MPFQHPLLICPVCGDQYRPLKEGKKYCSPKCRKRWNNQNDKAKRAQKSYELKRLEINSLNLKRLYSMPQYRQEVSREALISGGIDLDVPPKLIKEQHSGEHILCYGSYCIKLKDENRGTYTLLHLKTKYYG